MNIGLGSLISLGNLVLCTFLTATLFVVVVLWAIARWENAFDAKRAAAVLDGEEPRPRPEAAS